MMGGLYFDNFLFNFYPLIEVGIYNIFFRNFTL